MPDDDGADTLFTHTNTSDQIVVSVLCHHNYHVVRLLRRWTLSGQPFPADSWSFLLHSGIVRWIPIFLHYRSGDADRIVHVSDQVCR